jgi:hypothetical protein
MIIIFIEGQQNLTAKNLTNIEGTQAGNVLGLQCQILEKKFLIGHYWGRYDCSV